MKIIDISGQKFNRLTVKSTYERLNNKIYWDCVCECGSVLKVESYQIRKGLSKSCGCYKKEKAKSDSTVHGMCGTKTHRLWSSMIKRVDHDDFYLSRKISICNDWRNFENFYRDMGEAPDEAYCLDRINTNNGYEKGNTRWATAKENAQNTKRSYIWDVRGNKYKSLTDASSSENIPMTTIRRWCINNTNKCYREKVY